MATQLEFLMQLYMMNLIQQQQQQLIQQQSMQQQQQQQQNKDKTSTELATTLKGQQSPTNCSSSTSTSSSSNILLNTSDCIDLSNQYSSVQLAYENDNFLNSMYPVNFSKSFVHSSTVTSTPTEVITRPAMDCTVATDYGDTEEPGSYSTGTSGSINSGEISKISAPVLESPDSFSSPIMPFTPIKCETSGLQSPAIGQDLSVDNMRAFSTLGENEDSNFSHKSAKISPNGSGSNGDANFTVKSENSLMNLETSSNSLSLPTGGVNADNILQNEECLKYLKKFPSYLECENIICRQEHIREHFHCYDQPCNGKVLNKRDEIIRHLKWHKKRKESLLYGFMRFSSSDDCSSSYGQGCVYNFKQTHYHCIEEGCPKVYVSTSDVQMHANYHRKNSEIIQEGFKRFRAIEDCQTESCPFYGKKTSHYHCRRDNCQFTFKNKADMDKHKSYHLRDMRLTQDGFKKILKTEACPFENCRFSNVCNHIHCVREGCNYVLHSSSQLISHKRKHDRLDGEQAYQNFKKTQKESSEDDSPKSTTQADVSTPLSSLTSDSSSFHFLARKRGRPPKKIQLSKDAKKIKVETPSEQPTAPYANTFPFAPLLPQVGNLPLDNASPPNFQLTHLMAMFQLQNPLFYQNLYPGGMLGLTGASAGAAAGLGLLPQNSIFPTPASTPSQDFIKSEDKKKE